MRVALFFDGKNFYSGYKDHADEKQIDFELLSNWLVKRVNGSVLVGAHYYTGVEPEAEVGGKSLTGFLEHLETRSGFFVYRFPRKKRTTRCNECRKISTYSTEKEVDTTMVADMLRLAAVNAFDILILLSGDADHSPAIEGVRSLGKMAYVSTWGGNGLSAKLRSAAFDHIDLMHGVEAFADTKGQTTRLQEPGRDMKDAEDGKTAFMIELREAETKFKDGFVGVNYFLTRWESSILNESLVIRRRIYNSLLKEGRVECYKTDDGQQAMRSL